MPALEAVHAPLAWATRRQSGGGFCVITGDTRLSIELPLFPFYADELNTMLDRIRNGDNLLRAYRKHIYQFLVNEKGIGHWKVSLGYGSLQAAVVLSVL